MKKIQQQKFIRYKKSKKLLKHKRRVKFSQDMNKIIIEGQAERILRALRNGNMIFQAPLRSMLLMKPISSPSKPK